MNIATISEKRYTTKAYDASKKISEEKLQQIYTLLRNSPSSVNSQPWHFIVVSSDETKTKILPAFSDFNQARVANASQAIIFCAKTPLDEEHLQSLLAQEQKDGRYANEEAKAAQDKGRHYFVNLNSSTPKDQRVWEEKQIYIALGTLLLGAATLEINATPIEGFDTAKLDEILNLSSKGLASVVVACIGYHSEDDFNAKLPKSRLPAEQIFTFI